MLSFLCSIVSVCWQCLRVGTDLSGSTGKPWSWRALFGTTTTSTGRGTWKCSIIYFTKLPLLLLGVEEVRQLSNLLQQRITVGSRKLGPWSPWLCPGALPLAGRWSTLPLWSAGCCESSSRFPASRAWLPQQKGKIYTSHSEQLTWLSPGGPHPQIGNLARDEFSFCAGRSLGSGTDELSPSLLCSPLPVLGTWCDLSASSHRRRDRS